MDNTVPHQIEMELLVKRLYPVSKPRPRPIKKNAKKRFFFRDLSHIGYEQEYPEPYIEKIPVQSARLFSDHIIDETITKSSNFRSIAEIEPHLDIEQNLLKDIESQSLPGESVLDQNSHGSKPQVATTTRSQSGIARLFSLGTIKEFFKFSLVSATTFMIVLVGMNFSAYYQIGSFWLSQWKGEQSIETRNIENFVALNKQKPDLLSVNEVGNVPLLPKAGTSALGQLALNLDIVPPNNYIFIPKIGKNAPIVEVSDQNLIAQKWGDLEKDIQAALKEGVVHYPGTATPGQPGNFFITGHSSYYFWEHSKYKDIFALLDQLEAGDRYVVYYNQKKYVYEVTAKKVVSPSDTSVLKPDGNRKLSRLMTCTPVGSDLNRLIIEAIQV